VAIIATLAALLFPAINSSIARAKSAQCASNLQQLGLAFTLYSTENNNTLPPSYVIGSNGPDNNWWYPISKYTGATPMVYNWITAPNSVMACSMRPPFHCPTVKNPDPAIGANAWVSYKMNYQFRLQTTGNNLLVTTGVSRSRIPSPSKVLLLAEGRQTPEFWDYQITDIPYGLQYPHGGKLNALFLDGHVESFTQAALMNGTTWADMANHPFDN
jgi:prepilin-type processing-associated H-X9-DG protein